jgi:His/Glu/Gln/Arg/opine family amino acid ABC transporter permease subunit
MANLLRNRKTRDTFLQALYVGALAALVIAGALIARQNLAAQGIISGFDFLSKATGWSVSFSLLPSEPTDPYWWFFLIGIINTLFLGSFGLALATLVGTIVGLSRTSSNDLARLLGRSYVDVFRNIPLILQVFFWFAVVTHLPTPRAAHQIWGFAVTSRGFYVPVPNVSASALLGTGLAVIGAIALPAWLGRTEWVRRPMGERLSLQLAAAAAALAVALIIMVAGREPDAPLLNVPQLQGLNLRGGLRIPPEFAALAIAIAIYGGSYIGEIVRGGFMAVGKGQVEGAQSLGLTPWQVFRLVRLPLALRAMLPILANQYVWLMKATTMGIAIGFTDFFMIVALTINHSGQTLEAIAILMAGFLTINLSLAAAFNRINEAIALKGNQLRG